MDIPGPSRFPLTWESLCENINPAKTMAEDGEPNLCCHFLFLPGQHCAIAYFQKCAFLTILKGRWREHVEWLVD